MTPLKRMRPVADTLPEGRIPDESGIRELSRLPEDMADRKRITNLLSGNFLRMYQDTLRAHHTFGLLPNMSDMDQGHRPFPSVVEVADSLGAVNFALATRLHEPTLLLMPPDQRREDLERSILAYYGDNIPFEVIRAAEEIDPEPDTLYRPYLVDGSPEMECLKEDVALFPRSNRLNKRRASRMPGERGMSAKLYSLLAMQFIARGESFDQRTFTFLDAEDDLLYKEHYAMDLVCGSQKAYVPFTMCPALKQNVYYPLGHFLKGRSTIEFASELDADTIRGRFRRVLEGKSIQSY